jgi:hypothetical protein
LTPVSSDRLIILSASNIDIATGFSIITFTAALYAFQRYFGVFAALGRYCRQPGGDPSSIMA